uniref:ATP synthase complex subunit 8 n=1 Tax=Pomachromis fuscidorsalis TaxID=229143 RepID=Q7YDN1_9TELE|nr:ATP synthase 8 [Pomachromis fuscidorsalis]QUJ18415.1 ATP synthase protein 8 [Pomachromis fuscidorsalis]
MPQLNPTPWFAIMVFSWVVFLAIIPPKILAHTYPNEPAHQSSEKMMMEPWAWPWF